LIFSIPFIILLIVFLGITVTIETSSLHVDAFQQIAGPVIININPGETKSFSWGLLAENNETSMLKIYSDGEGSEFLSLPENFRLSPGLTNYLVGNVTIPASYPTNVTLSPIIHSTVSENDTSNTGGTNAVNIELSKIITISIGANNTQAIDSNTTSVFTQKGPPIGFLSDGTINSVISTPLTKWIASGNWTMNVNNGNVILFATNMTWNNINGMDTHTHEFENFIPDKPILLNQSAKNVSIKGLMDVGTNQRIVWKDIPSTIDINEEKTISISVDNNLTNQHFASQPILGLVTSFTDCSDIPGPNMEILTPCTQVSTLH
jgi:hypothetical protein